MTHATLVFLHLADIHFQRHSGDKYDSDDDLRNELLLDVERVTKSLPEARGILLGGDIAFSGTTVEYARAKAFLQDLSARMGIASDRVWCVPGNHDVDRDYVEKTLVLKDARRQFRQTKPAQLEERIGQYMRNPESSELLLRPITEYNKFAAAFRCAINAAEPVWREDFPLSDGSIVRLSGLNSTMISDRADDESKKVLLGRFQIPQTGSHIIHVCMCHHPPDWWLDEPTVDQTLTRRARIQLFGHKHHQWLHQIDNTLRLSAGAVHPSRADMAWTPRFNWLSIGVTVSGNQRHLQVDIYPRVWDGNDGNFAADRNSCDGQEYKRFQLDLDPLPPDTRVGDRQELVKKETSGPLTERGPETEHSGSAMMDPVRTLTYRFFSLAHVVRLDIARDLKLLKDEDEGLQDYELFRRILNRAVQAKLMADLWDRVEGHQTNALSINPFRK